MVTVSAPGKLMLMGEHAVVYGYPCMVTAVDQRLYVCVEQSNNSRLSLDASESRDTRFVDATIAKFFVTKGVTIKDRGISLKIRSDFTSQMGFGSSSAVSVATLGALGLAFEIPISEREIFDLAYEVTLEIQGVGSGFDIAAATYGGTLFFKKGGEIIEPIHARYRESTDQTGSSFPLIIGYTGIKADTATLVKEVAAKRQKEPEKVDKIFTAIGQLVLQGKEALRIKDWERLGTLMNFNQDYLRDLGVSSEKLEDLISAAKSAGAWGAKLSGAGGGDCMIAIGASDKREAISKAIQEAGGQVMRVHTHAQGIRREENRE